MRINALVLHGVSNGALNPENTMKGSERRAESNQEKVAVVRGRRSLVVGASAAALGALLAGCAGVQAAGGGGQDRKYRAIVHVTDGEPDKWTRVIGYVRGLESTSERADLAVAVIVQGLALDMLRPESPVAKAVGEAIGRGVEVIACEYSMKVRNLSRAQLTPSVVSFVPFGGMEIIKRQNAGWAYIRP